MIRKTTLFVMCLLLFTFSQIYAQSSVKAIVGGTLVNPGGAATIKNSVVLIEGNVIIKVGKKNEVKIPAGAEIIDAEGKWIILGLIDSHVHFFQSGGLYTRPDVIDLRKHVPYAEQELVQIRERLPDTFARYIRCGITSVVDVGGPFWNFKVRELARKTALAPRVAVAGPLASTYQPEALTTDDPPIIKVNTVAEARALVQRQIAEKVDLIKIWYIVRRGQTPADNLHLVKATIDESHSAGVRVAVHATQLETARAAAVKAGADILVHSVTDQEVDEEFIQLLKKNNVIYTTSLVVFEGYPEVLTQQVSLTAAEHEIANPFVVSTLFDLRHLPRKDIPERRLKGMDNPEPVSTNPVVLTNLKRLQDSGVLIAAGTDAGNIGTLHGPSIFREFELMTEAGLSSGEILTAATINGARLMGKENKLGTIEKGKLADLVLLNSDPIADIQNTSDIHLIVKNGNKYWPEEILSKTPVELIQQQVNAYNARDIKAFLATYSPEVQIYNHPDSLLFTGLDQMETVYSRLFENNPKLHVEIINRIVSGDFIIDQERVTGFPNDRVINAVAIYEVKDVLIHKVWFVRE